MPYAFVKSHPSQKARRMGHPSFCGWLRVVGWATRPYEEVNVLGHDDVPEDFKLVGDAGAFEGVEKDVFGGGVLR